jgi:polysaccharide pyruvyl transferase WcaK-like protein
MNTLVLMTATGAENLWDELITLCEIEKFRIEDAAVNIILFSHSPSRTWRFFRSQNLSEKNLEILPYFPTNIRQNPLKNIGYFLKTLQSFCYAKHIYIGGGGLLYSNTEEGHSPLRLWWMRAILAKMLRKPITYLSLWVSAKESEMKKYAKGIFKNTTITLRDKESQKKVLTLWYNSKIKPDPVFGYRANESITTSHGKWKTIGIALRSWFVSDEIMTTVIKMLLRKNFTIYLLPHSLHPDDVDAHDGYYLQKFLFPWVKISQTIEQTLTIYPLCNIIIGMRLHSIILASVMKIPLIAISYGTKTTSILTEMNQPYLDAKEVTSETLLVQIDNLASL